MIVRQTDYDNVNKQPVKCVQKQVDFSKQLEKEGVPLMNAHESRFQQDPAFDTSTLNSKIKRVPGRNFESYVNRSENLIAQGGNILNMDVITPGARCDDFYSNELKERNMMPRLNVALKFDGQTKRKEKESIYFVKDTSYQVENYKDDAVLK